MKWRNENLKFVMIPNRFLYCAEIKPNEMNMMIVIISHKYNYCLSDVQLAQEMNIERKTVKRIKDSLIEKGFIQPRKVFGEGVKGFTYKINFKKMLEIDKKWDRETGKYVSYTPVEDRGRIKRT